MKYLKFIATLIVLIYVAHLSDTIYVVQFKPFVQSHEGVTRFLFTLLFGVPRFIIGVMLGSNLNRINKFIWGDGNNNQ